MGKSLPAVDAAASSEAAAPPAKPLAADTPAADTTPVAPVSKPAPSRRTRTARSAGRKSVASTAPATDAAADPAVPAGHFTLDSPIAELIADPGAKAVLDRDLPGMSDDANLDKFKSMSLRQFQPMTGGQMTDALLAKVGADLGDTSAAAPATPVATEPGRKDKTVGR